MYDIGDDDLARSYDPKKVAANFRTPKLPDVECNLDCVLQRVKKDRAPKAGNLYEFKFKVIKSNTESIQEDASYTLAYFPGSSDVDFNMFWERVTGILMAAAGATNVLTFNAAEQLGEFISLCKADESLELGLGFRLNRVLEACRPDKKTGVVKHTNADGTPKKFPRDGFLPASAAPAQAA
ncbi:MAG: hypothetical protein V4593_08405 [Pseudomonadota bacterium]